MLPICIMDFSININSCYFRSDYYLNLVSYKFAYFFDGFMVSKHFNALSMYAPTLTAIKVANG